MAHRRLSILDVSRSGHQPMQSANGRFTIVFNGEIYNFRSLRAELERAGTRWSSRSDTEVLLESWCRHGPGVVERLEGMFAFAIWDAVADALYVARDPFGIKPLYYAEVGGGVLVASEVRALLATGLVPRRVDARALAGYLTFGSVPEPDTIIAGVRALPAGVVLRFTSAAGSVQTEETLRVDPVAPHDAEPVCDLRAAAGLVRSALEHSIDRHLVSDVPVAVFLSGGLDSSAVAALASERAGSRLDGFTVTFAERRFDERRIAALVAQRYGIRHHEIPLSASDLLGALPHAFAAMDQPSLDGINTWIVSQAVRSHGTKVVLSGLGGDELFGGYPSFRRARVLARYARLPSSARSVGAHLAARAGGIPGAKIALGLSGDSPADGAYLASRMLFGERQVARLCGRQGAPMRPAQEHLSLLQRVSWRELTGYMRDTLLRDSDVFSMAHALELRVPFVDREVARAAFAATDSLRLAGNTSKPLLVEAVRDLVPAEVWDRPKQGFVVPFSEWMRGPLVAEMDVALGDPARLDGLGLDPYAAMAVWRVFRQGQPGMTWSRPWALYALVRWATEVGVEGAASRDITPILEPAR